LSSQLLHDDKQQANYNKRRPFHRIGFDFMIG
jgi:hypothetical protein